MTTASPRFPGEWEPHTCVWTAWPSDATLWEDNLDGAREEVAAMIAAIIRPDPEDETNIGEPVKLLFRGDEARAAAADLLGDFIDDELLELVEAPIGDVWLRDTGPIFVGNGYALATARFAFNGWGGKYLLPDDDRIAELVAARAGFASRGFDMVLEGGAIDTDGEGTIVTTRQCLLNANRNPGMSQADVEPVLRDALGAEKVIWLDQGLVNDHTDGHVDNIARFVAPGKLVCMRPMGDDDPNAEIYGNIRRALENASDAWGRPLEVIEIPSPGLILDDEGKAAPASHVNFYIANRSVVMPVYAQTDAQHEAAQGALEALSRHIDRPHFHGLPADRLLTGGGSFHCITQQQPLRAERPDQ